MPFWDGCVSSVLDPAVIIEVAYFLRAKLPLGQSNLASGRGLIYQQSNLIFSVWTKCNSVPVSSP